MIESGIQRFSQIGKLSDLLHKSLTMKMRLFVLVSLCSILTSVISICIYHQFTKTNIQRSLLAEKENFLKKVKHDFIFENGDYPVFRSSSPSSFITAAEKGVASVVYIKHTSHQPGMPGQSGSGVLVSDDGFIVTNFHVVGQKQDVQVVLHDKRSFQGKVVGIDENTDLALIKIEGDGLPFLAMGNSDSLQVGEWVLGVGNPFNLQSTVTAGIVSAKARNINLMESQGVESFIQTDVAVNPGSSGGALINTDGILVGINTAILTEKGHYEGYSFSIPVNMVKKVVKDLKEFGVVQRGWMGIEVEDVTNEIAKNKGLTRVGGVFVSSVLKDGAAKEAGLLSSDIITEINDMYIENTAMFMERLAQHRPGDVINTKIWRNENWLTFKVTLKNHLNSYDQVAIFKNGIFNDLGLEVRDLDSFEKSIFGKNGVLVISVLKGSKIFHTKMEPGFIILEMDGITIQNASHLQMLCQQKKAGKTVWEGIYKNYPGRYPYIFEL